MHWKKIIGFFIATLLAVALLVLLFRQGTDISVIADAIPPSTAGPVEFSVMTFNVQARPWLDDAVEKLPKISPLLRGNDFVAIQECFQRFDLLWADAEYPSRAYFGRYDKPYKLANSGLAVLTRMPVDSFATVHYAKHGDFQNRIASKGILLSRLRPGGLALDVYNTHMEAGDTPEAQVARHAQARQMVEYVSANSPGDRSVIIVGDFNMGPRRAGKVFGQYNPQHYSTAEDLEARTAAFEIMREGLSLRDALDEVLGPVDDGIERFMFRAGTGHKLTPLTWHQEGERFRRADGSGLSDGAPSLVRFRIEAATAPR